MPVRNKSARRICENIEKSNQDNRLYRGVQLDNGVKCLLISDPLTERSAASIDVHVGNTLDPDTLPGLAHFCEHMLFMGSKKYPVENHFLKFIEDHAGSSNAYTSDENTNFYFDVAPNHFKETLDMYSYFCLFQYVNSKQIQNDKKFTFIITFHIFNLTTFGINSFSQFFISPLFDADSVDREIKAVDSENQKNLMCDIRRINQLEKSTCRADHPFSKFGTGNLSTLKTEPEKLGLRVRDELIKFYAKYYSSNLMNLCLLGKETLDELQAYAVDMFSDIPNKNLPSKQRKHFNSLNQPTLQLTNKFYILTTMDIKWSTSRPIRFRLTRSHP